MKKQARSDVPTPGSMTCVPWAAKIPMPIAAMDAS
jgi:hypothetical protein